jgi:hypothetical protein
LPAGESGPDHPGAIARPGRTERRRIGTRRQTVELAAHRAHEPPVGRADPASEHDGVGIEDRDARLHGTRDGARGRLDDCRGVEVATCGELGDGATVESTSPGCATA